MNNLTSNIDEVLREIKEDVQKSLKNNKPMTIPPELCIVKKDQDSTKPLLYSEELNYLNANWANWNPITTLSSHHKYLGPFILRTKRMLINFIWNNLFHEYFEREREFNMNLVRHLNAGARYIDARDKELFWQLINKLDSEVKTVTERVDYLYFNALSTAKSTERETTKSLSEIKQHLSSIEESLSSLKSKTIK